MESLLYMDDQKKKNCALFLQTIISKNYNKNKCVRQTEKIPVIKINVTLLTLLP